jgi:hypothetical protein
MKVKPAPEYSDILMTSADLDKMVVKWTHTCVFDILWLVAINDI